MKPTSATTRLAATSTVARTNWVSEAHGKVFCLVDAPSAEAAVSVHRQTHGLIADGVFEVREGL